MYVSDASLSTGCVWTQLHRMSDLVGFDRASARCSLCLQHGRPKMQSFQDEGIQEAEGFPQETFEASDEVF